jgi:hypothetical protein
VSVLKSHTEEIGFVGRKVLEESRKKKETWFGPFKVREDDEHILFSAFETNG